VAVKVSLVMDFVEQGTVFFMILILKFGFKRVPIVKAPAFSLSFCSFCFYPLNKFFELILATTIM